MSKKALYFFTLILYLTTTQANNFLILGYWENWGGHTGFPIPSITQANETMRGQLTALNGVVYSFLQVSGQGIYFTDPWTDLSSYNAKDKAFCSEVPTSCPSFKGQQGGFGNFNAFLKTAVSNHIFALGGAGQDASFEMAFKYPDAFFHSLKLLLKHYPQISGIDLNYEPLGGIPDPYILPFLNLVKGIKAKHPTLKLSWTLIPNQHDIARINPKIWQELAKNLDYIGLMGYDCHGSFDKSRKTNLHSPLYTIQNNEFNIDKAIQTLNTLGIPDQKILLGLALYGRAVAGVTEEGLNVTFTKAYKGDLDPYCETDLTALNFCPGAISYKKIMHDYPKSHTVYEKSKATGAWIFDAKKELFISFDNKESAVEKANYAKEKELAGVFFWALRFDLPATNSQSLLGSVAEVFGVHAYLPEPENPSYIYGYYTDILIINTQKTLDAFKNWFEGSFTKP